jgi:hypothetical protein
MITLAKAVVNPGGPMVTLAKAVTTGSSASSAAMTKLANALNKADPVMTKLAAALVSYGSGSGGGSGGGGGGGGGGTTTTTKHVTPTHKVLKGVNPGGFDVLGSGSSPGGLNIGIGTGSTGPQPRTFNPGGLMGRAAGGAATGWALVGEYGRELVRLPGGSSVMPHGGSEAALAAAMGGGSQSVTLSIEGGQSAFEQFMSTFIKNFVRVHGGGDVQRAFGRS